MHDKAQFKKAEGLAKFHLAEEIQADPDYEDAISRFCYVEFNKEDEDYNPHCFEGPCHSRLSSISEPCLALATAPNLNAWLDESQWGEDRRIVPKHLVRPDHELKFLAWWHYITQESPLADIFLTKDLLEGSEEGVLLDVHKPANLVMLACISTRHPHEYPDIVVQWYDLVQAGGDPWICTLLAEMLKTSQKPDEDDKWYLVCERRTRHGDIHQMYNSTSFGLDVFRNFVNFQVQTNNLSLYEIGSYYGVHDAFGGGSEYPKESWLQKEFDSVLPKDRTIETTEWSFDDDDYVEVTETVSNYETAIQALANWSRVLKEKYLWE